MVDGSVQIKDLTLVGTSGALRSVNGFIEKAARADCPVLILGEFGVGKKHVAYALHVAGLRHDHPFVHVRCDALDLNTFDSHLAELFGQADQGTIFFDGMETLAYPLHCQLAEGLESGVGSRPGRNGSEKPVGARVIASAGRELEAMVQAETFSRALLEELRFLQIRLAPLRERREDIQPLAEYFLRHYAGNGTRTISDEVVALLEAYAWPRNVSELKRVVACLAVMAEGDTIGVGDVAAHAPEVFHGGSFSSNGEPAARRSPLRKGAGGAEATEGSD